MAGRTPCQTDGYNDKVEAKLGPGGRAKSQKSFPHHCLFASALVSLILTATLSFMALAKVIVVVVSECVVGGGVPCYCGR